MHLCIAAAVSEGAYLVSQLETHCDHGIGIASNDGARNFEPREITGAGRRVVVTLALQNIGPIHSAGEASVAKRCRGRTVKYLAATWMRTQPAGAGGMSRR